MTRAVLLLAAAVLAGFAGCGRPNPPPAAALLDPVMEINAHRARKDVFFRDSPQSPLRADPPVPFSPLRYFPADPSWIYQSRLEPESNPRPLLIRDTAGQQREATVIGRLSFTRDGRTHSLSVYRMAGPVPGSVHYSIWFTDRTTGQQTYEVGRYLDFLKDENPDHIYTIDFNRAYNPYCAYAPAFACPIPRKEDHLDLAVTAGEMKWRD